jgi:hypothetical protein
LVGQLDLKGVFAHIFMKIHFAHIGIDNEWIKLIIAYFFAHFLRTWQAWMTPCYDPILPHHDPIICLFVPCYLKKNFRAKRTGTSPTPTMTAE